MLDSSTYTAQVEKDLRTLEGAVASSDGARAALRSAECGSLETAPDRLVVFGRETMACAVEGDASTSHNQKLAQRFIASMNDSTIDAAHPSSSSPYVSMMCLPAGKALMRLCRSDTPIEVLADGQLFSAGSLAANGALIDVVARRFAEQGSGIFSAAVQSAAPNTFLRCVEMHALRENDSYTGVRVLESATPRPDAHAADRTDAIRSKILSVDDWCYAQKAQWWHSSLNQLSSYLQPNAGFDRPPLDSTLEIASARFIGELYHADRELRYLECRVAPSTTIRHEAQEEAWRLGQGLHYIEKHPAIISPVTDPKVAFYMAKMFVYDIPENAKERGYVLSEGTSDCIDFVNDQIRALIARVEAGTITHRGAVPRGEASLLVHSRR